MFPYNDLHENRLDQMRINHVDITEDEDGGHLIVLEQRLVGGGQPGYRITLRLDKFLTADIAIRDEDEHQICQWDQDEHVRVVPLVRRLSGRLSLEGSVRTLNDTGAFMLTEVVP